MHRVLGNYGWLCTALACLHPINVKYCNGVYRLERSPRFQRLGGVSLALSIRYQRPLKFSKIWELAVQQMGIENGERAAPLLPERLSELTPITGIWFRLVACSNFRDSRARARG